MAAKALFGRYWEAQSPIHGLDPRAKLIATALLVAAVLVAGNFYALAMLAFATAALFALARVPFTQALRSIAPLSFIIVLTAAFNLFFVQGGATLVSFAGISISEEGLRLCAFMAIRLTLLLLVGSLLTLTTTSLDISEATERLLSPMAKIGVPAHEFAFVMGIALRFLPQFADELQSIRTAQLARGAKLATSPVRSGISSITCLIVPLFASAFRHADTLSAAMDARCYHGASGRTRINPLAYSAKDALAIGACIALLAAVIALNLAFG